MSGRKPSINVALPRELIDRLDAACRANLVGRTLVLQTAIERIVEELEARPAQSYLRPSTRGPASPLHPAGQCGDRACTLCYPTGWTPADGTAPN